MFKEKIPKLFISLLLIFTVGNTFAEIPDVPLVEAKSYVLMDYETGSILKMDNANQKLPPASLTKVMTAYVVFDEISRKKLDLNDKVKISKKAWKTKGSRTFLKEGDYVLVETLIKGMIIQSGNDASVALAEHISGSVEDFSVLMNYYAKKIGLENSNFENPTGLPSKDHYTTAMDLAILTRAIIRDFPEYYYTYQLKSFTYGNIQQTNRNRLLSEDLGFDGLKTGFTNEAGYCYIGSSKRGDTRLIVTLMGEPSPKQRFEDAKTLVNYGFRFFETHYVLRGNKAIEELNTKVVNGETNTLFIGSKNDVMLLLERGQIDKITYDVDLIKTATAPVKINDVVGSIKIILDGKVLKEEELITLNEVQEGSFLKKTKDYILEILEGF